MIKWQSWLCKEILIWLLFWNSKRKRICKVKKYWKWLNLFFSLPSSTRSVLNNNNTKWSTVYDHEIEKYYRYFTYHQNDLKLSSNVLSYWVEIQVIYWYALLKNLLLLIWIILYNRKNQKLTMTRSRANRMTMKTALSLKNLNWNMREYATRWRTS